MLFRSSYTIHEALATGLPVYAFDIGAQGEAVAAAANGTAMPFQPQVGVGGGAAFEQHLAQDILHSLTTGLEVKPAPEMT